VATIDLSRDFAINEERFDESEEFLLAKVFEEEFESLSEL
jgi:hypothetical protein